MRASRSRITYCCVQITYFCRDMSTDTVTRPAAKNIVTEDEDEGAPVGLRALCTACSRLYPEQPNPLQVTARVKYWLGGPDPLDYVSMYWNAGRPQLNVPPHWHYVSMGVSDLHGDGRVHPPPDRVLLAAAKTPQPSGYGFEMTFRLSAPPPPIPPPVWPAALLQSLARYIFTTGVGLCVGDHISWHAPLDGAHSKLRHLLVAEDPQLGTINSPLGEIHFVQLVGATERELCAAQRGAATEVLRVMSEDPSVGSWLVTDVARRTSCAALATLDSGAPADLAGVSTQLRWMEWTPHVRIEEEASDAEGGTREGEGELNERVEQEIKTLLQRGLSKMASGDNQDTQMSTDSAPRPTDERQAASQLSTDSLKQIFTGVGGGSKSVSMCGNSLDMWSVAAALQEAGAPHTSQLRGVHIVLNAEGGSLLPLALRGRVLHQRHFTWKCASGERAVTFVPPGVSGALASPSTPYVATKQGWLQVSIPSYLAHDMLSRATPLERRDSSDSEDEAGEADLPLVLEWPRERLKITVLHPDTPVY